MFSRRLLVGFFAEILSAFGVTWLVSSPSSASMPTLPASSSEVRRRFLTVCGFVGTLGLSWPRAPRWRPYDLSLGVAYFLGVAAWRVLATFSACSKATGSAGRSGISLSERDDELRARCRGGRNVAFDRSSDLARESSLDFRLRGVWNVPRIASKSEVSMRLNGRALVVGLLHSSDLNSMGSSAEPGRLGDSGSC